MKDTEEVSLPPIHGVEADGDVVQEQLPADPAHLFSCPLFLLAPHAYPLATQTSVLCVRSKDRDGRVFAMLGTYKSLFLALCSAEKLKGFASCWYYL